MKELGIAPARRRREKSQTVLSQTVSSLAAARQKLSRRKKLS
jgi:hypothetical protein